MTTTDKTTAVLEKVRVLQDTIALAATVDDGDEVIFIDLDEVGRANLGEIASLCLDQAEEIKKLREVVDEAAESLNHVRNIAYSSDDHSIMNIAEDGLKKLRPFLSTL